MLRTNSHLRRCLSRCQHCRIFFLTHPRNAGRSDLRCPFGCREAHRKQRSTERSTAYYTTVEGKVKKRLQNGKRGQPESQPLAPEPVLPWHSNIVDYVVMVVSLIEGRRVSQAEILQMLVRALRQHSMARRRKMAYFVTQLQRYGP